MSTPRLIWFRNDLRLNDHPALAAASDRPIIAVYILDEINLPIMGAASKCWLHYSLTALQDQIAQRGGYLNLLRGDSLQLLPALAAEFAADGLYFSHQHLPQSRILEQTIFQECTGLQVKRFSGELLQQATQLLKADGSAYQVFTPFYRRFLAAYKPSTTRSIETCNYQFSKRRSSLAIDLEQLQLLPTNTWHKQVLAQWQPGEDGARQQLHTLGADKLHNYELQRDLPAVEGTSRLSPHLHFGEISPSAVWQHCEQWQDSDAFRRQLVWREFCAYLLQHWPHISQQAFKPVFEHFPWQADARLLHAWQRGLTGYPLVDAGMRELWQTGWMHNRVRMVAASFLCKHLLQPWQDGAAWFMETLVDADIANNYAGWQWVTGSGADAAPYFRIFNPTLQSKKFDPAGKYLRRWLPELRALPDKHIHAPEKAPATVLAAAGLQLSKDYPLPIVNHEFARQRALDAYATLRNAR